MPMISIPESVKADLEKQASESEQGLVEVSIQGRLSKGKLEAFRINGQAIPGYEKVAEEYAPSDAELDDVEPPAPPQEPMYMQAFKQGAGI